MKSIAFFNNKGGVGKTTLTCNIAFEFAKEFNLRVAVVDCDPQCNATLLIVGEEEAIPMYWNQEGQATQATLMDLLQPIEDGDSNINVNSTPFLSGRENRFLVDLLPGHPRISIIEERLSAAWRDIGSGSIEGLRRTNWVHLLNEHIKAKYDLVFYDLGPSLGALNRSCLLGCDYFVTPMGADIFSMIGLRNIDDWMKNWVDEYSVAVTNCEVKNPGRMERYNLKKELTITNGYLGYTVLSYIASVRNGVKRPTKSFEQLLTHFPTEVTTHLGRFAENGLGLHLGDIPNMYSLAPLAQSNSCPVGALTASDGLVGAHFSNSKAVNVAFIQIAENIKKNIGL